MRAILFVTTTLAVLASTAMSQLVPLTSQPVTAGSRILSYHWDHVSNDGQLKVIFAMDKNDAFVCWVDTNTPLVKKVKLTLSNGKSASGTPELDGRVVIRMPKMAPMRGVTGVLQADNNVAVPLDDVSIDLKILMVGQSNMAMTQPLFTTPSAQDMALINEYLADPNMFNVNIASSLNVASVAAFPAGASTTPQDNLPVPPAVGWVNAQSSNLANVLAGQVAPGVYSFAGIGRFVLLLGKKLNERLGGAYRPHLLESAAISTLRLAWSAPEWLQRAGATKWTDPNAPRNALNRVSGLFNGQLHSRRFFAYNAVIMYQRESDAIDNKADAVATVQRWHQGMRELFGDDKLAIIEIGLPPYGGGNPTLTRLFGVLRDMEATLAAQSQSYVINTRQVFDAVGRSPTDGGLHNRHMDVVMDAVVDVIMNVAFGANYDLRSPILSSAKLEYKPDNQIVGGKCTIEAKFKYVAQTGLKILPATDCTTCTSAPLPIELRYNNTWTSVSSVLQPDDTFELDDDKIKITLQGAAFRPVVNGIRSKWVDVQPQSYLGDDRHASIPFEVDLPLATPDS